MITKVNPYGHISLTNDYFSGLVEQAAKQCYGDRKSTRLNSSH